MKWSIVIFFITSFMGVSCSSNNLKNKPQYKRSTPSEISYSMDMDTEETESVLEQKASVITVQDKINQQLNSLWEEMAVQSITKDDSNRWSSIYKVRFGSNYQNESANTLYDVTYYDYLYLDKTQNNGSYTKVTIHYADQFFVIGEKLEMNPEKVVRCVIDHGNFVKLIGESAPSKIKFVSVARQLQTSDMNSQDTGVDWSTYSGDFDLYKFTLTKYNSRQYDFDKNHYFWELRDTWVAHPEILNYRGFHNTNNVDQYYLVSKGTSSDDDYTVLIPVEYDINSKIISTYMLLSRLSSMKTKTDPSESLLRQFIIFKKDNEQTTSNPKENNI